MTCSLLSNPSIAPYADIITATARAYRIPPCIIATVILNESGGNPKAWNGNNGENSRGLMQISERTALREPLAIPYSQLNNLFDPRFNIEQGAKLLRFIADFLDKELKGVDERTKWTVILSSYNQGERYYKLALQELERKGYAKIWKNIEYQVLNPPYGGRTPWEQNVRDYGPKAVARLSDGDFEVSSFLWLGIVAFMTIVGVTGYIFYREKHGGIRRNPFIREGDHVRYISRKASRVMRKM